jgi:membrane protein implicated in regulation of membrane protease activity
LTPAVSIPAVFDPWLWLAAAAVLAIVEAVLPGYLLLGFGIGAVVVALALFPLGDEAAALPYAPVALLAIWAAVSLLAWFGLTGLFGRRARRRRGTRDLNDFDNRL